MSDEEPIEDDPELAELRAQVEAMAAKNPEHNTLDWLRLEKFRKHLHDAEVGFTSPAAVKLLYTLDHVQMARLATMALRWFDSPWSDKDRDLGLGIEHLLGRKPTED